MGVLFAALTTLCMLSLISAFYQADKVAVTLTLVNVGMWRCLAWSLIA